jgi:hypothetical protein
MHMENLDKPYSVAEISTMMGLSARVVTWIFENEKGVFIYQVSNPQRKRAGYRSIRIPRHVYERVKQRYTVC